MEIGAVRQPDFEATAHQGGTSITLHLKGDASGEGVDAFEQLLKNLHIQAVQRKVAETSVDIRQLEFMSSSWFKCLVTWVTEIQALDQGQQYSLRFLSNPNIGWQKRSLRSLAYFAVDLIKIDASA